MKTAEIRQRFLDFFADRGHTVVPSASLLYNDPTLLFVNAGMVQFKPYFIGTEPAPFRRATSVQKCVRTLDIDEVGKTTRHGTFFQMNGNFSFGDYFKAGAIDLAWEFVTGAEGKGNLGFDPERVWVTCLDGDDEAIDLWRQIGLPAGRIQRRGLKDNYWNMGVPGPGGPCSEIYIDRGPEFGPDGGPEADEDRFLEIWNLVFMQEELSAVRAKDDFDVARPLPKQNIDTGMGLERVALLKQGKDNMYEIDEVWPVIALAVELSGREYHTGSLDDVRLRVVADHVRSSLMLLTDGVTPGNEGRGYVLRRLLRRVVRSMRMLGVTDPVLPELLPVSRDVMSASYPEIHDQWDRVSTLAYNEERAFRRTLAEGSKLFDGAVAQVRRQRQSVMPGDQAFQLHDTYGFPIDLTLEMAAEQGISVDRDGFLALMADQKARAKADAKLKKGQMVSTAAYGELRRAGESRFVGHTDLEAASTILGLIDGAGRLIPSAGVGDEVEVVLADTPFYAEAGGQDADAGQVTGDGLTIDVIDVQKPVPGLIVHRGVIADGTAETGARVRATVDAGHRFGACQAHSATHIVHAVLRQLLGPTATQAGSYNKPGYLRFDFSTAQGLSDDLKAEVEGRSNAAIHDDLPVATKVLPLAEAQALGAMAMFGEKYGAMVRVVEIGGAWSREFCGGTHVAQSGQIGLLALLGEQSVGSGVRRLEALVSTDAFDHLAAERAIVANLTGLLRVRPDQLADRVGKLMAQLKQAEKTIADLAAQQAQGRAKTLLDGARQVGPTTYVGAIVPVGGNDLRALATDLAGRLAARDGVVALVGTAGAKPSVVVATTEAARARGLAAGSLVGLAAGLLGGRGGGTADLAQGGGSDATGAQAALDAVASALAQAA